MLSEFRSNEGRRVRDAFLSKDGLPSPDAVLSTDALRTNDGPWEVVGFFSNGFLPNDGRLSNDGFLEDDGLGPNFAFLANDFEKAGFCPTGGFFANAGLEAETGRGGGSMDLADPVPDAADFSLATSSRVRLRNSPGGTSRDSGPYCTRLIFST